MKAKGGLGEADPLPPRDPSCLPISSQKKVIFPGCTFTLIFSLIEENILFPSLGTNQATQVETYLIYMNFGENFTQKVLFHVADMNFGAYFLHKIPLDKCPFRDAFAKAPCWLGKNQAKGP